MNDIVQKNNSCMAKSMDLVCDQLQGVLERFVGLNETIRGLISSIDVSSYSFRLGTPGSNKTIECRFFGDLSKFSENSSVIVSGCFRTYDHRLLQMYFLVDHMYFEEEREIYTRKLRLYRSLKNALKKPNHIQAIRSLKPASIPYRLASIGLIALASDINSINTFRTAFVERCNGNLIIYRLCGGDNNYNIEKAVEYLCKQNVDLICILTCSVNVDDALELSSQQNISYLINRNNTPYIIAITDPNANPGGIQPLIQIVANRRVPGIGSCIDLIQRVQGDLMTKLIRGIDDGNNLLHKLIQDQKDQLTQMKCLVAQMTEPEFDVNKIDLLKAQLIINFHHEKCVLCKIQRIVTHNFIKDFRIQTFLNKMNGAEQNTFDYPSTSVSTNTE